MPFGMVNGVGRGRRVLDGMGFEGKVAISEVNLGRPVETNGDFVA